MKVDEKWGKYIFVGFTILIAYLSFSYLARIRTIKQVSSFEECVEAGLPILTSYPEQCRTPDGRSFTRSIGNEMEMRDKIKVTSPRPNDTVTSPLTITGEAVGSWFFEATFPVRILDGNGKELGVVVATAEGEWMTEDFVKFSAELNFNKPDTETGTLVLEKDNPSGLPEMGEELRIPVRFNG